MRRPDDPIARAPEPGEEPEILELLDAAFGGWPGISTPHGALEHLRWKLSSPATARDLHRVLEVDGRLAGFNTTIIREAWLSKRRVRSWGGGDTSLHPDFQGRGLYRHLTDYSDGLAASFEAEIGHSGDQAFNHVWSAAGKGRLALDIEILFRPTSLARHAAAWGTGWRRRLWPLHFLRLAALQALGRVRRRARPGGTRATLRDVERFDPRVDALSTAASTEFDFIVCRESDYLNWRFCDRRGGEFQVTLAEEGDDLVGYRVTKLEARVGYIADLLALPGRLDVADALIQDAQRRTDFVDAVSVACWMPEGHPYNPVLRRNGFISTQRVVGFHFHSPNGDPDLATIAGDPRARVHIVLGDTDEI